MHNIIIREQVIIVFLICRLPQQQLNQLNLALNFALRTVPIIVTAHTFCASRDTRVSFEWCLLTQGYFCAL